MCCQIDRLFIGLRLEIARGVRVNVQYTLILIGRCRGGSTSQTEPVSSRTAFIRYGHRGSSATSLIRTVYWSMGSKHRPCESSCCKASRFCGTCPVAEVDSR